MLYRGKGGGRRRGVVAVLVAVSLVVLLGAVALAADGGMIVAERRHAQAVADAAARAAATDLFENWPRRQGTPQEGTDPDGTAAAAAVRVASDNGYTAGNSTVTVRISPQNYQGGSRAGQSLPPGYAEVMVQYNLPRAFSTLFGRGDLPVHARSVARAGWVFAPPVWVGDLDAEAAFWVANGSGNITIGQTPTPTNPYGGRAIVNSSALGGAINDLAGTVSASEFFFGGRSIGNFSGTIHNNAHPTPDPLGHLPPPPTAGLPTFGRVQYDTGSRTLDPGVYNGGIAVGRDITSADLTLNPGIYYMRGGGFSFNGSGRLRGNGVLIYNAPSDPNDLFQITGTGNVTLSPPTSGPYQGLTIWQDRNSPAVVIIEHRGLVGTEQYNITGAVYAANARILNRRKVGDQVGSQFICRILLLSGSGNMSIPGNFVRQRIMTGVE